MRPVHRRQPRGERQRRGGDAGQEARCAEIHRPHRQQRIPRTQQQGDVHRHGHRLPVLPREGRGPRGDQPAGTHFDHGVRRFFERQTFARGFPSRTGLAAGGGGAHGLRRRPGPVELPHGGHHARRADDHSARGRTVHGGRRDLCHRASGRRAGGDGVFGPVEHRDQEHDDPRRFAHRHPHRHRVAGRGEHQTDRLQRREGLPAGRDARQDADHQRGRPQHRGDDGGGAFEHGRLRCRDGAQRDQHPGGDARQAHGGQEGDRRGRESQLHKPRRVDRHRHDHQQEAGYRVEHFPLHDVDRRAGHQMPDGERRRGAGVHRETQLPGHEGADQGPRAAGGYDHRRHRPRRQGFHRRRQHGNNSLRPCGGLRHAGFGGEGGVLF